MSVYLEFLFVLLLAIIFLIFLFTGFWMGRQTQGKEISITPLDKTGGQPAFEEDPYEDALRREKGEGGL